MPVVAPNLAGAPDGSRAPVFAMNLTLREEQRTAVDVLVKVAAIAAVVAGIRRVGRADRHPCSGCSRRGRRSTRSPASRLPGPSDSSHSSRPPRCRGPSGPRPRKARWSAAVIGVHVTVIQIVVRIGGGSLQCSMPAPVLPSWRTYAWPVTLSSLPSVPPMDDCPIAGAARTMPNNRLTTTTMVLRVRSSFRDGARCSTNERTKTAPRRVGVFRSRTSPGRVVLSITL